MSIEEIISKQFGMTIDEVRKNSERIDECNATRYWEPFRGGYSLIVSDNGDYLGAVSAISPQRHLEEFKTGRRNGNLFDEESKSQ